MSLQNREPNRKKKQLKFKGKQQILERGTLCSHNLQSGPLTFYSAERKEKILLYLPTQIRFLIGGERVMCHWSKLHDALGRTKLHDALGQQQLELSTHT